LIFEHELVIRPVVGKKVREFATTDWDQAAMKKMAAQIRRTQMCQMTHKCTLCEAVQQCTKWAYMGAIV